MIVRSNKCYYHQTQSISNFCINPDCSLPLCPQCIKTHIQQHQQQQSKPYIQYYQQSYQRAVKDTKTKIDYVINLLNQRADQTVQRKLLNQLGKARTTVVQLVNKKFDILQAEVKQAVSKFEGRVSHGCVHSYSDIIKRLRDQLNKTQVLYQQMTQGSIKPVIKYYAQRNPPFDSLITQLQLTIKDSPKIEINLQMLQQITKKLITIKQSFKISQNQNNHQIDYSHKNNLIRQSHNHYTNSQIYRQIPSKIVINRQQQNKIQRLTQKLHKIQQQNSLLFSG